jgi:2-polyprenyl-3-methyl-5-hydroxy-6-metoxy-1,4-benzoquinol methylase
VEAEKIMGTQPQTDYALGQSERELQRLIRQSALYADLTEELLRSAGISEGMRVLDVGCGSGCVSLLAARLVGSAGAVVGVDRSPQALALARSRAEAEQLNHVEFIQSELADLQCEHNFDALIGRFVLMFLPDPAAIMSKLSRHVRRGGIIAFQEMDISAAKSMPVMPIWRKCSEWILETFQRAGVDIQMGPKLHATFLHAGLPQPQMQLRAKVGGAPDFPAHEYVSDIVASLLPMMERFGVATAATVEVDTLAARLGTEMISMDGVTILPSLVGAWARKSG